jgi:hypothetical protein
MKLKFDVANMKYSSKYMIISTSNPHCNSLMAIRARNAAPKTLKIQTRKLFHG